jgi:hypothetical protein
MLLDNSYLGQLVGELRSKNIVFELGLTDSEILRTEREYEFKFPPDLQQLLQFALPVSDGFPNWRTGQISQENASRTIREQMAWPFEGICFDIDRNNFWAKEWGQRPERLSDALTLARKLLVRAPKLVAVYTHRYIPCEPRESGNPVFSVHQTDVIYYGTDLASYFAREFEVSAPERIARAPREIAFWSSLAKME